MFLGGSSFNLSYKLHIVVFLGVSRNPTPQKSKIKLFVPSVKGFQLLTNVTRIVLTQN